MKYFFKIQYVTSFPLKFLKCCFLHSLVLFELNICHSILRESTFIVNYFFVLLECFQKLVLIR